jgi:hypothetical protein
MQREDHFSDVVDEVNGRDFGSLGGEGMSYHDTAKSQLVAEGVATRIRCEQCGTTNVLTVDWPELAVLSQSQLPSGWMLVKGNAVPNVGCRNGGCRSLLRVGFTPDEATKHLKAGIAGGKVSGAAVQQWVQQVQARSAR